MPPGWGSRRGDDLVTTDRVVRVARVKERVLMVRAEDRAVSKVPPELRYSESHEWVHVEGDTATIGITDFAQHALTDVVFVELPKKGAKVALGKGFGVVESVKSVSDLFAPLSGEVVAVNDSLQKNPEQINDDPYGKGWMLKVRVEKKEELSKLLDAARYKAVTGE